MNARYETPLMSEVWDERARNRIERELWIGIMQAQGDAGVDIPQEAIVDYRHVADALGKGDPDAYDELFEIAQIEAVLKHDLYARMQYFNKLAGHEYLHLGLTSADIVENTQQIQIDRSVEVLALHSEQVLLRLMRAAGREADIPIVGRTHGRPAQLTTVGKRVADWLVEFGMAMGTIGAAASNTMVRGVKGAIGTRLDLSDLLASAGCDEPMGAAGDLDEMLVGQWGFSSDVSTLPSTGQCYPRGLDLPIAAGAVQLAAACNTICTNVRLWVALGHASEMRTPEQVGSSAMPHKVNPRYAERVHGLTVVARGYLSMLAEISGGMWFDGDVSTSATRRVALPGLFHTVDAILANTAYVLDRLELDRDAIADDVQQHMPQLVSSRVLGAAVRAGMGRDEAHRALRNHSARVLSDLGREPQFPLGPDQISALINPREMTASAAAIARLVADDSDLQLRPLDPSWPGELL